VPRQAQQRLLDTIPDARLVICHGYGHAIHWENPERFVVDLVGFLVSDGQRDALAAVGEA